MENDDIYLGDYELTITKGTHEVVGPCYIETHTKNQVRHRLDEPAVVYKHLDTLEPFRFEWHFKGGIEKRPNNEPSIIDKSSVDVLRIWADENGWIGQTAGPAKTWTAPNGIVVREEYMLRDKFLGAGTNVIERDRNTGEVTNTVNAGQPIPEYSGGPR